MFCSPPPPELSLNEQGIHFECFGVVRSTITYDESSGDDTVTRTASTEEFLFQINAPTNTQGRTTKYPRASITRFPFEFRLPRELKPTTEAKESLDKSTVKIEYGMKAVAHVSGLLTKNLRTSLTLIVDPQYALAAPQGSLAEVHAKESTRVPNFGCFACLGTKAVKLSVQLPRSVFSNGELIPINITIENGLDKSLTKVDIRMVHQYDVRVDWRSREWDDTIQQATQFVDVPPRGRQHLTYNMQAYGMQPDVVSGPFSRKLRLIVKMQLTMAYKVIVRKQTAALPVVLLTRACLVLVLTFSRSLPPSFSPLLPAQVTIPLSEPCVWGVLEPFGRHQSEEAPSTSVEEPNTMVGAAKLQQQQPQPVAAYLMQPENQRLEGQR